MGTPAKQFWYEQLPEQTKQALFAYMRGTRDRIENLNKQMRSLHAPQGQLEVGPAAFDPFLQGEAYATVLAGIGRGLSPDESGAVAKVWARAAIKSHNAKRPKDYNWARWEGAGDNYIDTLVADLNAVVKVAQSHWMLDEE